MIKNFMKFIFLVKININEHNFKHNAQSVLKLFNKVTDESVNPE